jgi:hypothetical protein
MRSLPFRVDVHVVRGSGRLCHLERSAEHLAEQRALLRRPADVEAEISGALHRHDEILPRLVDPQRLDFLQPRAVEPVGDLEDAGELLDQPPVRLGEAVQRLLAGLIPPAAFKR